MRSLARLPSNRHTAFMSEQDNRQPGDIFLDRYFPNADADTRERARKAFRDFAFFLLRMGERLEQEAQDRQDSTEQRAGATISEALPEPPS